MHRSPNPVQAMGMEFFLSVSSILAIPMFLYFLVAASIGFFSAKHQALVMALAGLAVAWMCVEFGSGDRLAPFAIYPALVLYALTTIASAMASRGIERAYASTSSTESSLADEESA